ncbi:methyltransferase [Silvanigrella sp.]|jgi:spermidine synthase|uniref:spermine/spermidine synthase domain-containing protein n=1 Tax=Silvanigrella sp. TaxID=2024976 RepID=UPI0037C7DD66
MFVNKPKSNIWMTEYLSPSEIYRSLVSEIIYQGKSLFQNISIVKLLNDSKALYLDNQLQSTTADEFIYHETIVHIPFILNKNPESILIIGAGEGATAREALKWKTVKEITLIEIDKDVIEFCSKYLPEMSLNSYKDPRVKIEICDARVFLENTNKKFDVIICDLCDQNLDKNQIINIEFLKKCKNILNKNGNICIQSGEMPFQKNLSFTNYIHMLKTEFNTVKIFTAWIPSFCRNWSFFLLHNKKNQDILIDEIKDIIIEKIENKLFYINDQTILGVLNPPKYIQDFEK